MRTAAATCANKVRFSSKKAARDSLRGKHWKAKFRAYQCNVCFGWHYTKEHE